MPRYYRRRSDSLSLLLKYIEQYQAEKGVAPTSYRAIGLAIGLSPIQVSRLLKVAIAGQMLRLRPGGLCYDVIFPRPSPQGTRWVPRLDCSWLRPIEWKRDDGHGALLDIHIHRLAEVEDPWVLCFNWPHGGYTPTLHLDPSAFALVSRGKVTPESGKWYVFCFKDHVVVGCASINGNRLYAHSKQYKGEETRIQKNQLVEIARIIGVIRTEL